MSQSGSVKQWQSLHPSIEFRHWPQFMANINPLNNVWANIQDNVEDPYDPGEISRLWKDLKEDSDDFRHLYALADNGIKKVIRSHNLK